MLPLKPDPAAARDLAVRSLVRAAIAKGLANLDRGTTTAKFAAKSWPDDDGVPLILRGATLPTAREDYPALAAVSTAFLAALVPMSAGADLFGRSLDLSFGPGISTISVPRLAIPNADFVREREAIPVYESQASAATLSPHKIKSIVMATWELLNDSGAEDLLRQMMVESTGPALDRALFSAAAATPERPAGLLNGIAPLTSTGNLTNDLIMLLSQIAPVSGNSQIAVVAAPDKAIAINLLPRELPYPVLTSASLPSGTLIAVALNALVSATDGAPQIQASSQAVVHAETARDRHRRRRRRQADPLHVSVGHDRSAADVGTVVGIARQSRRRLDSGTVTMLIRRTRGRLTPLQRAYCLGYKRALFRMRRELKDMIHAELAELRGVVDGIERDYENAKAVARAMAERDPEVRLH